ncbi:MAG: hypothetical protein ABI837_15930 [Acidobacteriota bacterium]
MKSRLQLAACFVSLFIGFVLGCGFGYFGRGVFHPALKPTIDILQAANILVTIFIAFVVQTYIMGRRSTERVEKDLIIGDAQSLRQLVTEIRQSVTASQEQPGPHPAPTTFLARFSLLLESAESLQDLCKSCFGETGLAKLVVEKARDYHRQTTVTFPFSAMSERSFTASEKEHRRLIRAIADLIVEINRK